MTDAKQRLELAARQLKGAFVGRDDAIDCIMLALVAGTNFILVGDPGTAKSALVRCAFSHVAGGRLFKKLCGSFATMDEMVGPTDIKAFKSGDWKRVTKGRLADCEFAFLDEVMKSNDGTLNSLLGMLNEREYEGAKIPLWAVGAATNWPEVRSRSETVAALWDRFLLRCRVDCLTDPDKRAKMIDAADAVRNYAPSATVTLEELEKAREEARAVKVSPEFVKMLVSVAERLRAEQVPVSDRRLAALMLVVKSSAWLAGRDAVEIDDIDALLYGFWNDEAHIAVVKSVLDSVDGEVQKRALRMLADARQNFARDVSGDAAVRAMRVATSTAKEIGPILKSRTLRKANHALVSQELDALRREFNATRAKLKPMGIGKDDSKDNF